MAKITSIRLPDQLISQLKEIAERENIDTSTLMRKLLTNAMKERLIKETLEDLNSHKISIGQAAKRLEINLWDMIDLTKKYNINWTGYNEEDLERDLKILHQND